MFFKNILWMVEELNTYIYLVTLSFSPFLLNLKVNLIVDKLLSYIFKNPTHNSTNNQVLLNNPKNLKFQNQLLLFDDLSSATSNMTSSNLTKLFKLDSTSTNSKNIHVISDLYNLTYLLKLSVMNSNDLTNLINDMKSLSNEVLTTRLKSTYNTSTGTSSTITNLIFNNISKTPNYFDTYEPNSSSSLRLLRNRFNWNLASIDPEVSKYNTLLATPASTFYLTPGSFNNFKNSWLKNSDLNFLQSTFTNKHSSLNILKWVYKYTNNSHETLKNIIRLESVNKLPHSTYYTKTLESSNIWASTELMKANLEKDFIPLSLSFLNNTKPSKLQLNLEPTSYYALNYINFIKRSYYTNSLNSTLINLQLIPNTTKPVVSETTSYPIYLTTLESLLKKNFTNDPANNLNYLKTNFYTDNYNSQSTISYKELEFFIRQNMHLSLNIEGIWDLKPFVIETFKSTK